MFDDNSLTFGSSASVGRDILSTLSFMSTSKFFVSTQVCNSTVMDDIHKLEVEDIFLIHSISFISFSILSVIKSSIS